MGAYRVHHFICENETFWNFLIFLQLVESIDVKCADLEGQLYCRGENTMVVKS